MRHQPRSPAAEMLRTIATNLSYMTRDHGARMVLVTSALRGEGKSTIAANLAVAVAESGKRVVLMSCDLRRPRMHRLFDVSNEGVADVVSGSKSLADVLSDPGVPNLRFIGSGPTPRDPAVLLGSQRMAELMDRIRAIDCDLVIFDCPPVLAVADASILVRYADAVLYVVDAKQTTRSALSHARGQLTHAGARILGGVFNNFSGGSRYPGDYSSYGADDGASSDSDQAENNHAENGRSKAPVRPWARISR
jgi:capsular exopolysaccharide synthesis family protein